MQVQKLCQLKILRFTQFCAYYYKPAQTWVLRVSGQFLICLWKYAIRLAITPEITFTKDPNYLSHFWWLKWNACQWLLGPRVGWPRFGKKPSTLLTAPPSAVLRDSLHPRLLNFPSKKSGYWTFPQRNVNFFFHCRSPVHFGHTDRKTAPYFVPRVESQNKGLFWPQSWTFIFVSGSQFTNIRLRGSISNVTSLLLTSEELDVKPIFFLLSLVLFFVGWRNPCKWYNMRLHRTTVWYWGH